jgi:hypothetical protein
MTAWWKTALCLDFHAARQKVITLQVARVCRARQ